MGFKAVHYKEVTISQVEEAGAKGVQVRWVINKEDDGAKNFAMRLFEIETLGYTPDHSHNWEHEIYVIEGKGSVLHGDSETQIKPGYVIYIPPNVRHQLRNGGEEKLLILCLIPY